MSVLIDYKVELFNKVNLGKGLSTKDQMLTSVIFDHYNIRKANQLLDDICNILSGISLEIAIPTPSLYLIEISLSTTKIYDDGHAWEEDNNIIPSFTLPTVDFKIIVEAWRDYITQ